MFYDNFYNKVLEFSDEFKKAHEIAKKETEGKWKEIYDTIPRDQFMRDYTYYLSGEAIDNNISAKEILDKSDTSFLSNPEKGVLARNVSNILAKRDEVRNANPEEYDRNHALIQGVLLDVDDYLKRAMLIAENKKFFPVYMSLDNIKNTAEYLNNINERLNVYHDGDGKDILPINLAKYFIKRFAYIYNDLYPHETPNSGTNAAMTYSIGDTYQKVLNILTPVVKKDGPMVFDEKILTNTIRDFINNNGEQINTVFSYAKEKFENLSANLSSDIEKTVSSLSSAENYSYSNDKASATEKQMAQMNQKASEKNDNSIASDDKVKYALMSGTMLSR